MVREASAAPASWRGKLALDGCLKAHDIVGLQGVDALRLGCLGHQILGLAAGGRTYKLPFGHHGANHPVKDLVTGKVEITSQNHGFAVEPESVEGAGWVPTHVNLNDGTCEGLRHRELPAFSVQYHPEASPGPHDANYLFERFAALMAGGR